MAEARATTTPNVIPLRLPNLDDGKQPGGRFVKRAVSVTLSIIVLIVSIGVIVSLVVSMDVTVKSSGVLEPVNVWPVRAQATGPIREVLVQSGDTVKAGDVIIRLDALSLEAQLAQLEAQYRAKEIDLRRSRAGTPLELRQQTQRLASAQSRLTSSRAMLVQRMVEYGFGSNADSLLAVYRPGQHVMLDQAVGEVRSAEAEIRLNAVETDALSLRGYDEQRANAEMSSLQAQIREVRERIARTTIAAPAAGVVLTEQLELLGGASVREGETLMEVGELGDWRVTMLVPESKVHKISVGDRVAVEVQAFGQRERRQLEGRVSHVAAEPVGSSQAGSGDGASGGAASAAGKGGAGSAGLYRVVASLDRAQIQREELDRFRRGYSVQANVVTKSGRIAELVWGYVIDKFKGK